MKQINYKNQNAILRLRQSLSFYSDWIDWNMDDSTQKRVSIDWSQGEDEETGQSYFLAEFHPDKAFANGLEDGDLLRLDYKEDGANISLSGVASPVLVSPDSNNNTNNNIYNSNSSLNSNNIFSSSNIFNSNGNNSSLNSNGSNNTSRHDKKTTEIKVQIKFLLMGSKKDEFTSRDIKFLIDSLNDVTVVNIGLFNNYLKQKRNIRSKLLGLASDGFLCKILSTNVNKSDNGDDDDDDDDTGTDSEEEKKKKGKLKSQVANIERDNILKQQVILDNVRNKCYKLNDSQKIMIEHALNNRITLVMGPPGTGKTFTSAVLACNLFETKTNPNAKILVCASSNVAVDNLAMAIHKLNKVKVVRMRSQRNERHDNTQSFHLDRLMKTFTGEPFEDYRKLVKQEKKRLGNFFYLYKPQELAKLEYQCEQIIFEEAHIICCTCSGSTRLDNFRLDIDSLIIDECSQVTVPEGLLPVQFSPRRVILVGDDNQLGPVIKDRYADKYCDDNLVLYSKLKMIGFEPKLLDMQYRMHPELVKFANEEFYEARIQNGVGHDERRWTHLKYKCPFPDSRIPIYFQCHKRLEDKDHNSTSRHNNGEINIVVDTIKVLLSRGVQSKAIGVITPYSDQCKLIEDKLKKITRKFRYHKENSQNKNKNKNKWIDKRILATCTEVEVATVDAYQGREKDYIIVSFVRSSLHTGANLAFIADKRRLNVTLTRAKYGIIIIGNPIGMDKEPLLDRFIKDLSDRHLLYDEVLSETSKPLTLEQFESRYFHFKKQPKEIEIIQID